MWQDWFGTVQVGELTAEQASALEELGRVLEALQPTLIDRGRSTVLNEGHGWVLDGAVEVCLTHAVEPDAEVYLVFGRDEALLSWLNAHEHFYPSDDSDTGRSWTLRLLDATASVLLGEYEIVDRYRGDRLVRTEILDLAEPDGPVAVGRLYSLFGWLPGRRPTRVERRRLDYGVPRPQQSGGPEGGSSY